MLQFSADASELQPLIDIAVERALAKLLGEDKPATKQTATPAPPAGTKLLFSEKEAAATLSVSPLTLRKWREKGCIASFTTNRPVLYRWQDIEKIATWMSKRNS